jgi:hypothetical protein
MRRARVSLGRPVAADADMAVAMVVEVGTVVARGDRTEAVNGGSIFESRNALDNGAGQGWIRTSEGVKPADLQSAPFGHFGTYPSVRI